MTVAYRPAELTLAARSSRPRLTPVPDLPSPSSAGPDSDQSAVRRAVTELGRGRPVLIRSGEPGRVSLVYAADSMTVEQMAFLVRHSSGFVCVALETARAEALELTPQTYRNQSRRSTGFTVTVDAATGIGTGISATDRCHTVRLLADPTTDAADFTRPGHVVPIRAVAGGVLERAGVTEASVELLALAGRSPVAVLADLALADAHLLPGRPVTVSGDEFAAEHAIVGIEVAQLVGYCEQWRRRVSREASARIPTEYGEFTAVGYLSAFDGLEHVAFVHGEIDTAGAPFPVLVHRESVVNDCFGRLLAADATEPPTITEQLAEISRAGRGVLIYLRSADRSGSGLLGELQRLQAAEHGIEVLGEPAVLRLGRDRETDTIRRILDDLGVPYSAVLTGTA